MVLLTVALGFAAGALWELYEWFANNVLGGSILVSYDDTIADLLMGGTGSLIAGLSLAAWLPGRLGGSGAARYRQGSQGELPSTKPRTPREQ